MIRFDLRDRFDLRVRFDQLILEILEIRFGRLNHETRFDRFDRFDLRVRVHQ